MPNFFNKILFVDNVNSHKNIYASFGENNYVVEKSDNFKDALNIIEKTNFDYVVIFAHENFDIIKDFIKDIKKYLLDSYIIIIGPNDLDNNIVLDFIKFGAHDYLYNSNTEENLLFEINKLKYKSLYKLKTQKKEMPNKDDFTFEGIVAKSNKMLEIFSIIKKVADYKTTVLLLGESGTGKELVARALHNYSSRCDGPFVVVNCGAIPETLLESELFGYVKGAFTGAYKNKKGLFEEANHGTIFLDEIAELPLLLQVKILRALQEEEIKRVGDNDHINIDIRIIAATLRNLTKEVELGNFREDLYYRLNVLPINITPLRERKDDIDLLVDYFIIQYNKELNKNIEGVNEEARRALYNYHWPGNVRELEHTLQRAILLTNSTKLRLEDLPEIIANRQSNLKQELASWVNGNDLSIKKATCALESDLIKKALKKTAGNRGEAAKLLEISPRTLVYKMQEYNIIYE
jgi:two-component system response regulator AtoC